MKAKDIRKGNVIMMNKVPHQIMETIHRTPGNLRAFVQMKLRNLINNSTSEHRFSSVEDLEIADLFIFNATYMYADSEGFHFMNSDSYDQVTIPPELIGDGKNFLMDGMKVQISTLESNPIGIVLPKTVVLEITETSPELKGATVTNVGKPATTNTGLVVTVPGFIKQGEKINVDTDTGQYLSRAE